MEMPPSEGTILLRTVEEEQVTEDHKKEEEDDNVNARGKYPNGEREYQR
jgi:hypothetical protein